MRKWELIVNLIFLFGFSFVIILITIPLLIIGPSPQRYLWLSIIMFSSGIILLLISKRDRFQKSADVGIAAANKTNLNRKLNIISYVSIITGLFFLAVYIMIAYII